MSENPSGRPRAIGILGVILAVLLAGVAAFGLWPLAATAGGALVGPAAAATALAIVSAIVAVLALQVPGGAKPLLPLRWLGILAFVFGIVGAGLGFILGAINASSLAIGCGVGVFAASLVVFTLAALGYRAAERRA